MSQKANRTIPKTLIDVLIRYRDNMDGHKQELYDIHNCNLDSTDKNDKIIQYAEEHNLLQSTSTTSNTLNSIINSFQQITAIVNKAYVEKHQPGHLRAMRAAGLIPECFDEDFYYANLANDIKKDQK